MKIFKFKKNVHIIIVVTALLQNNNGKIKMHELLVNLIQRSCHSQG